MVVWDKNSFGLHVTSSRYCTFHCTMTEMRFEHLLIDAAKSTLKTVQPPFFRMDERKDNPCTLVQLKFFESG